MEDSLKASSTSWGLVAMEQECTLRASGREQPLLLKPSVPIAPSSGFLTRDVQPGSDILIIQPIGSQLPPA